MNYKHQRERMVENQIKARGVKDKKILEAMKEVPRHKFIEESMIGIAYNDNPLPIGHGQTISQPYIVARMTEMLDLEEEHEVLEVGTGSGYQAAILSKIVTTVVTVERIHELYINAKNTLQELGYNNIIVVEADGSMGYKKYSPYDRIIVTASSPGIPESLVKQLKDGGKMVIPVGNRFSQRLQVVKKKGDDIIKNNAEPVRFVPLIGKEAWDNQ